MLAWARDKQGDPAESAGLDPKQCVLKPFHTGMCEEIGVSRDLVDGKQYAYMSHFFANPLTVLLQEPLPLFIFQEEVCESIRNLDSFRQLAEAELSSNNIERTRLLLNDNDVLQDTVAKGVIKARETLTSLITAVDLLSSIQTHLDIKSSESWANLYIKAMAGELRESTIIQDTLLAVRKMPSNDMSDLLKLLSGSALPGLSTITDELRQMESDKDRAEPLRSQHDIHHKSLRTTIVAHKVELSKHQSSLSQQDRSYSDLVDKVSQMLEDYFHNYFINPQDLFLHEVLIYDLKSPHREVFAPKPRCAIERALSSPRDYLGCTCCQGSQHGLSGSHPATSILYQLYLESGAIINIADLWSAFYTIVGAEEPEDEDAEQEKAL
ncbi:MAG: hypothetical protein Q9219_000280 [cf. Caloplaca sp. 3 TL-2023]